MKEGEKWTLREAVDLIPAPSPTMYVPWASLFFLSETVFFFFLLLNRTATNTYRVDVNRK